MRTTTIRLSHSPPIKPGAARKLARTDTAADQRLEALKRTKQELKDARDYAEAIVEAVPPLLVLDSDLRVKTANESFYKHFRVSLPQTENCLVYELGNGQWNIPKLRTFLEEVLPRHSFFKDFEVTHTFESIGRRTVLVSGHQVDHLERILLFLDDITERVESRAAIHEVATLTRYASSTGLIESGRVPVWPVTLAHASPLDARQNPALSQTPPDVSNSKQLQT